jgi:SNF2 family DNA or RNA helicase
MKEFNKIAVKIDGTISGEDRELAIKRFENDDEIKIFIGQTQAAGEGINLGAAQTVIFMEFEWTPASHEQAEGRLKGLRQKGRGRKHTYAYYFMGTKTIDEEIAAMLENKRQVINGVIGAKKQKMNFNFLTGLVK